MPTDQSDLQWPSIGRWKQFNSQSWLGMRLADAGHVHGWIKMKLRKRAAKLIRSNALVDSLWTDTCLRLHKKSRLDQARADASDIRTRLNDIVQRWPQQVGSSPAEPIFVFAAGWRSGSTLVQRMLTSVDDVMIWGEGYSRAQFTATLMNQFRCMTMDWPFEHDVADTFDRELDDQWIAGICPAFSHLIRAHRAFFVELFEIPARAMGRPRWGFKEVRLTSEHALYLKLLFPGARFVFLYRDPIEAYASFRDYVKLGFMAWPDRPIATASDFGARWCEMVSDFLNNHQVVGGMLVKYEQLMEDPLVHQQLCDYLGIKMKPANTFAIIGGRDQRRTGLEPRRKNFTSGELFLLKCKVNRLRSKLGYH